MTLDEFDLETMVARLFVDSRIDKMEFREWLVRRGGVETDGWLLLNRLALLAESNPYRDGTCDGFLEYPLSIEVYVPASDSGYVERVGDLMTLVSSFGSVTAASEFEEQLPGGGSIPSL